jgi:hypothetical protein
MKILASPFHFWKYLIIVILTPFQIEIKLNIVVHMNRTSTSDGQLDDIQK